MDRTLDKICPICKESYKYTQPYIICKQCHSVCETCINKIRKCPICKSKKIPPIRNIFLREMIGDIEEKTYGPNHIYPKKKMTKLMSMITNNSSKNKEISEYIRKYADTLNPNLRGGNSMMTPLMMLLYNGFIPGVYDLIIEFINTFKDKIDPNLGDINNEPTTAYIVNTFWKHIKIPSERRIELADIYISAFHDSISLNWDSCKFDLLMFNRVNERPNDLIDAFIELIQNIDSFDINAAYPWNMYKRNQHPLIITLIEFSFVKWNNMTYVVTSFLSAFKHQFDLVAFSTIKPFTKKYKLTVPIIKCLIDAFADKINLTNTLIELIINKPSMAKYLISTAKIDISNSDDAGYTPLAHAIIHKRRMVKTIIKQFKDNININRQFGNDGKTAIMLACQYYPSLIGFIFTAFKDKIDTGITDNNNNTLFDIARTYNVVLPICSAIKK